MDCWVAHATADASGAGGLGWDELAVKGDVERAQLAKLVRFSRRHEAWCTDGLLRTEWHAFEVVFGVMSS